MYLFADMYYLEKLPVYDCYGCNCSAHVGVINTTTAMCTSLKLPGMPVELVNETGLTTLFLDNNAMTSVAAGHFADFASLEHIVLDHNAITAIENTPWPWPASLKILNLAYNLLTEGAITGRLPATLQELVLSGNHFTRITAAVFTGLTQLRTLRLSDMRQIRWVTPLCFFSLCWWRVPLTVISHWLCSAPPLIVYLSWHCFCLHQFACAHRKYF